MPLPFLILALVVIVGYFIIKEGPAIVSHLTGYIPPEEDALLATAAMQHNVDVNFLRALRLAENGPEVTSPNGSYTRGMGIVDFTDFPSARSFEGQVKIAAQTLENTLARYRNHIGDDPIDDRGHYTTDFIRYFSWGGPGYVGYAPIGAANDPGNLNANHFNNLRSWYAQSLGPDVALT